jgi:hypothetical protein
MITCRLLAQWLRHPYRRGAYQLDVARTAHRECVQCPHPFLLRRRDFKVWHWLAFALGVLIAFVWRPHLDVGNLTFALDLVEAPQHWTWYVLQSLFWGTALALLVRNHKRNHRRRGGRDDRPGPIDPGPSGRTVPITLPPITTPIPTPAKAPAADQLVFADALAAFREHPAPKEPNRPTRF